VLAFATRQDRILVTSDLRTMPRHFGNFLEANGLLVSGLGTASWAERKSIAGSRRRQP
jgi:hypothetical protein